ncbi:reverse transcriptase domain-containing protein, partial [Enterobacter cloacae complex sp. 2DZ2F20B]|uniref:reverse transcriptase domain-containing protein n=1 Tax=Enterobacter cloacae complex sp. 2DZ2F20B TaxID=2511993 RepID=UPI002102E1B8
MYGVRGIPLQLIKSYLNGRTQCVIDYYMGQKVKSNKLPISKGIPQGSILGPLFYLIYANDLVLYSESFSVQFADDTNVIISESSCEDLNKSIERNLQKLQHWYRLNHFQLNDNKTIILKFNYKSDTDCNISTQNQSVPPAKNKTKFLGL